MSFVLTSPVTMKGDVVLRIHTNLVVGKLKRLLALTPYCVNPANMIRRYCLIRKA